MIDKPLYSAKLVAVYISATLTRLALLVAKSNHIMSDTIKIQPVKRTNFEEIKVGDKREIHAQSLATFKANLSRFRSKLKNKNLYKFSYSEFIDNFCIATRTS